MAGQIKGHEQIFLLLFIQLPDKPAGLPEYIQIQLVNIIGLFQYRNILAGRKYSLARHNPAGQHFIAPAFLTHCTDNRLKIHFYLLRIQCFPEIIQYKRRLLSLFLHLRTV